MMRDTKYATEIGTAIDSHGQSIERLYIKQEEREEIRFSWWQNGKLMIRPLDLPESELLELLKLAIRNGVFTRGFLKELHSVIYDERDNNP